MNKVYQSEINLKKLEFTKESNRILTSVISDCMLPICMSFNDVKLSTPQLT